jgi:hypothetical protein
MKRPGIFLAAVLLALLAPLLFTCNYGSTIEAMNALIATPGKLTYINGESFARNVLRVYGVYGDGETVEIPVSQVDISGTGPEDVFNKDGDWAIGVSYNDLHTDFLVKVISEGGAGTGAGTGTGDDSGDGLVISPTYPDW